MTDIPVAFERVTRRFNAGLSQWRGRAGFAPDFRMAPFVLCGRQGRQGVPKRQAMGNLLIEADEKDADRELESWASAPPGHDPQSTIRDFFAALYCCITDF
jgi:hypothetical protein